MFENYPLVPGKDFNVFIRGYLLEELDDVKVITTLKVGGILDLNHVQNLCKGPGRSCPYSAGKQEQRLTCKFKESNIINTTKVFDQ